MKQIAALIVKEFRQIFRDRVMVAVLFIAPLVQITVLGLAVTSDVKNLRVAVCDLDRSPMSRDFLRQFGQSAYFRVVSADDDYTRLPRLLDDGTAQLAIYIPPHFQRDIIRRAQPSVQLLVDGIDGNTAGVAQWYVAEIARRYQVRVIAAEPALALSQSAARRVDMEPRYWFNPNLESKVYIIPGIVALILTIITLFLTSMGIVREKEIGTLEQLMVTPIRAHQLVLGKVVPFIILGFFEINIAMGFVYLIFGITVAGSYALLMFESAIFLMTTLGLGIFVSTISETQQQALFVAWFFMIFAILLSGFFMPIANMPDVIQYITYLNPLRYFMTILREIFLKGTGLADLAQETISLAALGLILISAAMLRFRRKLA